MSKLALSRSLFSRSLVFLASFSALVGCAGTASTEPSDRGSAPIRASEPVPDLSGTWGFVLESSDVAAPLRQKCDATSGGDPARASACWDEIAAEARQEKIRFTKPTGGGEWIWTSFGHDPAGSSETIFLEMPVTLATDGPGRVLAKVAGKPSGERADRFASASIDTLRIEVVDAKTIAMVDPQKGRLVYSKE